MGRTEDALRKAAEERERKRLLEQGHARPAEGRLPEVAVDNPIEHPEGRVSQALNTLHAANTAARAAAMAPVPARAAARADERLVLLHAPSDPRAEQFRKIRANIMALKPSPRSILITSGAPGEGKSLTAANLALTLLEVGAGEVLLVDANLRHPELAQLLAARPGPGLGELISGVERSAAAVIQKTEIPGLALLAAGSAGIGAARLLAPAALKRAIESVSSSYRFVVVDSPAVTDYADSAIMSGDVDGVLLVVSVGGGRRDATRKAVEVLEGSNARLLGTVVMSGL